MATSVRETPDTWICDAAVALGVSMLQLGPCSKGENIAKINRLMEIARELEGEYA
jgi:enolase